MKKIAYLAIALMSMGAMTSCNTLDIDNIYSYDADKVWNDPKLANAYVANLYASIFGNWSPSADQTSQQLSGIHFYKDAITITNDNYKNWNYKTIRLINEAIQNVSNGDLTQPVKDALIGQSLFLRAYVYFGMVNYHGGIPYITIPQDKDKDDLYVKRNTTAECFDLILKDIDDAIALLPEKIASTSNDYGRIDGCYATAFKAKVLLYKASPQFNPNNPWDNKYWSEAYEENKAAYELLKKNGHTLVSNYDDLFLVERNRETVFAVVNTYPNKMANWDNGVRPGSESRGNAWAGPTWEFVKEFPMKDGKKFNDPTGKYAIAENDFLQNFWKNRDPRFEKSVVWNGSVYEVSGKKGNRQYTALGVAHEMDDFGVNPNANVNSTNLNSASGFFIRKASDLSLLQSEVQQYDIDYVVMRFAEVALNYAETANETGNTNVALTVLREIRERAGIEPGLNNNYGIDATTREDVREAILEERNIEFCFEGYRFWDVRRLRRFDLINGKTKHGVEAIAINIDGTEMPLGEAKTKASKNELVENNFKYILHQIPFSGVKETSVPDTYYFFPIAQSAIDRNSNLEQNSNWGGTFNPTLD